MSGKRRKPLKFWGRYGTEKIVRDHRGLVLTTTGKFEGYMEGTVKKPARTVIFSGGPPCKEYRYDTVSDEDRERLEIELGARFKRSA